MGIRIYLIEDLQNATESIELDTEDVDFGTTFAVAEIQDISQRKGSMTKQLTFKGTHKNNVAFGSLFHLNRRADMTINNKLFFNYSPLRTVDCIIEEDSMLVFQGAMRVVSVKVKDGVAYYDTVITSALIDLKEALSDKYLADIDFTDLRHHWNWNVIRNSEENSTERYDKTSGTYSSFPFQLGSGYVYPFIDYGERFKNIGFNTATYVNTVHADNFRPAIFLAEYLKRIFAQTKNTFEVKGSPEFVAMFNSLIVPHSQEGMKAKDSLRNFRLYKTQNDTNLPAGTDYSYRQDSDVYDRPISVQVMQYADGSGSNTAYNLVNPYGIYRGKEYVNYNIDRDFTCDAHIRVKFSTISTFLTTPLTVMVQIRERDYVADDSSNFDKKNQDWSVISSSEFIVPPVQALTDQVVQFEVGEHDYKAGKQFMLCVAFKSPNLGDRAPLFGWPVTYTITEAEVSFPKDMFAGPNNTPPAGVIKHDLLLGDIVQPAAPENIKQMDFLVSLMKLFNLYVYSEQSRPKHLIFQTYDDYYAQTYPSLLSTVALDWTGKVDHSGDFDVKGNVQIPKKYLFSFKDDGDYFNKTSKEQKNEVYGNFTFNDSSGITDQKKVEVIFSASPTVEYNGTGRIHAGYYDFTGGVYKQIKTNVRLLYYSGRKSCNEYEVAKDRYDYGNKRWDKDTLSDNIQTYACAAEYYFRPGLTNMRPVEALQFGRPTFFYFGEKPEFINAPNLYSTKYVNQVTQLTDANVVFVECDVMLDEVDIANLDLRVPVFIDMGDQGHAYFKVLSVTYESKDAPSKVQLQKITL